MWNLLILGMFMDEDDQKLKLTSLVNGGITTHFGKPAGKALSPLIWSELDIPAAWLDQQAHGVQDATAARSQLTQTIALETASIAVADPEIMKRAKANMVTNAYRHQENKDAVTLKSMQSLQADPHPNRVTGHQRIGWQTLNAMPKRPRATSCGRCLRGY